MGTVLGLASALVYGGADFVGGLTARKAGALVVVTVSQAAGLLLVLAALPLLQGGGPSGQAVVWGLASGVAGGAGVAFFYRALSKGRMSVLAPITAVEGAIVPVVWGLVIGERPGALALTGVAVALVAVVLVSSSSDPDAVDPAGPGVGLPAGRRRGGTPGLVDALLGGAAFGAFFITLEQAGTGAGVWPLVFARASSLSLLLLTALALRRSLRPPAGTWGPIVLTGTLDMFANLLYLLATGYGLLTIVAVLTSLYPASTVVLARLLLQERLARVQLVGLAAAAGGVACIALG